jgi:hypothetical protein
MTAARRLAAILAADVLGYSIVISEKEVGTAVCSCSKGAPCAGDAHDHPHGLFPQAGR